MKDLIRTDTIFGKRANIVGDISADLVLESLGKIYIKSRNSAKTLEEVILSVALEDINSTASNTVIVEGLENLNKETIKNGALVYDKLSNILYIWLDEELIELINVAPEGTGYVKKTGDTMTGRLTIDVPYGAPLYVNSTDLVKNLNANYLEGESAKSFTRRTKDETIYGKWTFRAPTNFESNTKFSSDVLINGSVGTTEFASGFGGYGWRIDGVTNTLTIDNLVVRKMMQVYELVVNKISATNGSLWVTNAGKVTKVQKLPIYSKDDLVEGELDNNSEFVKLLESTDDGGYFIVLPSSPTTSTFTGDSMKYADGSYTSKTTYDTTTLRGSYVVYLKDAAAAYQFDYPAETQEEEPELIYKSNTDFSPVQDGENLMYSTYDLFSSDFKFDATIPIIPRNLYNAFKISEEWKEKYILKVLELRATADSVSVEAQINNTKTSYLASAKAEAGYDWGTLEFMDAKDIIAFTLPYYKYFAGGDFYIVNFDDDSLPVFKPGDLLRCQKWTYGGIKYYDAVVCNYLSKAGYIIQLAPDINDKTTRVSYDDNLNPTKVECLDVDNSTLYELSDRTSYDEGNTTTIVDTDGNTITVPAKDSIKGKVEEKDSLVLMGNMWDVLRQNAVYITSTDDAAPYIDVLSGINRPDYSVVYYIPTYKTIKLNVSPQVTGIGVNTAAIPYTGDYYIQEDNNKAEYFLGSYEYNGTTYDNVFFPISSNSAAITNKIFLSTSPNTNTKLDSVLTFYPLLSEDDAYLLTEDSGYYFVQEDFDYGLAATSTRTVKTRLGNLDGIQDERFPVNKLPYGYGLYGQNVFLVGEFYLSNGKSLAEISNDAITFAIASRDALQNNLDILKNILLNDIDKAKATLTKNIEALELKVTDEYYSKSALKTAGMTIINPEINGRSYPSIALWGNYIMLATTLLELEGTSVPTAMFYRGRIRSKFLEIDEVHNTTPIGLLSTTYTYNGYTGSGSIYRYTFYVPTGVSTNPYTKDCKYVREFIKDGKVGFVAIVDINGNLIFNLGAPQYPTIQTVTKELTTMEGGGIYDKITNVTNDYVLNTAFFNTYNEEEDVVNGTYHKTYAEFTSNISGQFPVLWSLEADGSGNLGGRSFVWDTEGNVTMTGTIYADAGRIGGFSLDRNKIYNKQTVPITNTVYNYDTYFYLANDTTIPCIFLSNVKKNPSANYIASNNRALVSADSFIMLNYDGSSETSSQLIMNTQGLSWTDKGFKVGALAILASITMIPIWCDNGSDGGNLIYLKCYAADPVFNEVIAVAGYNGTANDLMGYSVIIFPGLDANPAKSSYIAKGLKTGKISIQVTSIPEIKTSNKYSTVKSQLSYDTYNPDFRNTNGHTVKSNIKSICFNGGIREYGYSYTNKIESIYYIKTKLIKSSAEQGTYTFYKQPEDSANLVKRLNFIEVVSGDDDTPNSGGYMLNIIANQYIEDSTSYEDPQSIIDSLTDLKTPEEVHQAYTEHYQAIQNTFNNAWYPYLSPIGVTIGHPNGTYYNELNALLGAINDCIAVDSNNDTHWVEDDATLYQTTDALDALAYQVKLIFENEKEHERWEDIYTEAAADMEIYASQYGSEYSYRNAKNKFDAFEIEIDNARISNDWSAQSIQTAYGAYSQAYSVFYRECVDLNELGIDIPISQS